MSFTTKSPKQIYEWNISNIGIEKKKKSGEEKVEHRISIMYL